MFVGGGGGGLGFLLRIFVAFLYLGGSGYKCIRNETGTTGNV